MRESLSKPGDFVLSVLTDQLKPGSDAPPAGATSASGARLKVTHIKIMCEVSSWESKREWKRSLMRSADHVLKSTGPVNLNTTSSVSEFGSKCCRLAGSICPHRSLGDRGH